MGGPDPNRPLIIQPRTMLGKANELAQLSGARVYLLIHHSRTAVVYNSVEEASGRYWPPSNNELVIAHIFLLAVTPRFCWQLGVGSAPILRITVVRCAPYFASTAIYLPRLFL